MKKINYITNLPLSLTSGGWGGINNKVYSELSKYYDIHLAGPISPNSFFLDKAISKASRLIGLRGKFHFFSTRRLNKIKKLIETKINTSAEFNFFFGATPWIEYASDKPYAVYLDASFLTYMEVFSTPNQFHSSDLKRIADQEVKWLQKADHIFWGSDWAKNELLKHYPIDHPAMTTIWTGGYIDIPKEDRYKGELLFTFISLNFEKKGGSICVETFKMIKQKHPQAELLILGQQPPEYVTQIPGISYGGYLKKSIPEDYKKFKDYISRSFLMVHPTKMDTMGAVIIESGYYGCPSIAPRSFGIPELIIENHTGLIVDVPFSAKDFADSINALIQDKERYLKMRESVRAHTVSNLSWEALGKKIHQKISFT